jgi:hypothetical protein
MVDLPFEEGLRPDGLSDGGWIVHGTRASPETVDLVVDGVGNVGVQTGQGACHAASTIVAAISLLTRCTVPLPQPTILATLRIP